MHRPSKRKTILVTAGPTVEPIDPIRYLSNYSTGEMGYELAKAAKRRGHKVILISGPASLKAPRNVRFIPVKTAIDMKRAVFKFFKSADCLVMAAAVSDFRPAPFRRSKIKKFSKKALYLKLKKNPDILAGLAGGKGRRILVGYSLETDNPIENAKKKLRAKKLDIIVVNKAGGKYHPFGPGAKDIAIIEKNGSVKRIKSASKAKIVHIILDKAEALW